MAQHQIDAEARPYAPEKLPLRSPVGITARAMQVAPTFDGGVIAAFSTIGGTETVVARGWPDGAVDTVWLDSWVEALDPAGVVLLANGDRFARVQLFDDRAAYWDGERVIDVGDTGALELPGLNDEIERTSPRWALDPMAFGHAVAGPPAVNETRTIDVVRESEFAWTVTVTTAGFFDDSVFAERLRLELGRSDLDGTFRFERGVWSQACAAGRGHQDFSPELCV